MRTQGSERRAGSGLRDPSSHPAGRGRCLTLLGELLDHVGPASGRAGGSSPRPSRGSHLEGESCNKAVTGKMLPDDDRL